MLDIGWATALAQGFYKYFFTLQAPGTFWHPAPPFSDPSHHFV
jgi:hypothetical protein